MSRVGALGGRTSSTAKAQAARRNGKLGERVGRWLQCLAIFPLQPSRDTRRRRPHRVP